MSTQIFINPNKCQSEYTKIVEHSFSFVPSEIANPLNNLFIGQIFPPNNIGLWSGNDYNLRYTYNAGILTKKIAPIHQASAIPLPINLVPNDIVTLNGTAYFNNADEWAAEGWSVSLVVGVYYFNCSDFNEGNGTPFTFIPVGKFRFNQQGIACFLLEETLFSNFDKHDTRFVLGYNIYAECTEECIAPTTPDPIVTVSHTFDIERPCAAVNTSFIIKNCCEPIITELVNIPGLIVGNFHVDDEGNCWEVISSSKDVTNFTRNFVDTYTSCIECQGINPCPNNLSIDSCCVMGTELVTGSLPGLEVGDTFVDNHGLCWYVNAETGAPISEESIVVDTIIPGGCEDCITDNPCPSFWIVESCCTYISEIILTTIPLNQFDSFLDTNGMCWSVVEATKQLPTNYGIVVDSVYTGSEDNCLNCTTDNPCPEEYFVTVRACCDTDRVEVIAVPAEFMGFYEGLIFKDGYGLCWEVMSYDTTGAETYPLDFNTFNVEGYFSCQECVSGRIDEKTSQRGIGQELPGSRFCPTLWQVRDCNTNTIYTAGAGTILTVGSFYSGFIEDESFSIESCFEVLGYGYPEENPFSVFIEGLIGYESCEKCNNPPTYVSLTLCCTQEEIIAQVSFTGPVPAPGAVIPIELSNSGGEPFTTCCIIDGETFPQLVSWTGTVGLVPTFTTCEGCTTTYPCA